MGTPDHTYVIFFAILISSIVAIPLNRTHIRKQWLWHFYKLPFVFYLLYEITMPRELWMRVDWFLIWPLLLAVLASRWLPLRHD